MCGVNLMEKYGRCPCDDCHFTQGYRSGHKANDLGFLNKYGKNRPVKAWKSGVVVATGTDSAGGVYVVLKHVHDDCVWISRYWHLVKGSVKVKKGQEVTQGQELGKRGNTGISTGVHLHFELWKCPSGYSYKSGDCNKYAVDPMEHTYLFEGQVMQGSTVYEARPEDIVKPVSVERDTTVPQIEVIATSLRVRTSPSLSGDYYCTCPKGLYSAAISTVADGYTWYSIEPDRWIASKEGDWTKYYPAESQEPNTDALSKEIDGLNKELELYKKALETTENTLKDAIKVIEDVRGAIV